MSFYGGVRPAWPGGVYWARVNLGLGVSGSLEDEEGGAAQRSQSQRARVGTREKRVGGDSGEVEMKLREHEGVVEQGNSYRCHR
jgi:hypothetical protein